MKRRLLLTALLALLLLTSFALATNGYDLSWWTVDGGGGTFSTGGDYTLGGTIGQSDAGLMAGGDYTLGGGFWGGGELHAPQSLVYLPITVR
jgi:hypothetical protein